jgi:hypothetical protein
MTIDYWLPTADWQLQTFNFNHFIIDWPSSDWWLSPPHTLTLPTGRPIGAHHTDWGLGTADCWLPTENCWLLYSDLRLLSSDLRPPTSAFLQLNDHRLTNDFLLNTPLPMLRDPKGAHTQTTDLWPPASVFPWIFRSYGASFRFICFFYKDFGPMGLHFYFAY